MKRKAHMTRNFNCVIETEGLFKVKVTGSHVHCKLTSRKRCNTGTLLLQTTSRKWCLVYRIVAIPTTLSDLQDHSSMQFFSSGIFRTVNCAAVDKKQ